VYPMTAEARPRRTDRPVPPRHAPSGEVVIVGAHGGAGVTTLAGLLRPAWDLGVARRPGPGRGPLRTGGRPVLLVARNTVAAAGHAVAAVSLLADQGVQVAVLAVIGDGLPEPAEARYRFRVLEGRLGAVVRVPFVPACRVAADPLSVALPRRVHRALAEIRALTSEQATSVTRP
jgi:hypothetical protein